MKFVAVVLGTAMLAASCSTPNTTPPPPRIPVSDEPIAVPTDGPRSPLTVLEALWERERQLAERDARIADLEAELARLRDALDAARRG